MILVHMAAGAVECMLRLWKLVQKQYSSACWAAPWQAQLAPFSIAEAHQNRH